MNGRRRGEGTRVVILGGGPAGLGAAYWLARRGFAPTLLEAQDRVGGNAGSFELGGMRVDYGSHRLHPATDPEILAELQDLLGDDLLERPRHGRILLGGRWIHFPLRPVDLALHAPPSFVAGVGWDALRKAIPGGGGGRSRGAAPSGREAPGGGDTFASVLLRGLGPTVCHEFYFPYARKIWGLDPRDIAPTQARKRVSAGSLGKLVRRLLPGGGRGGGRTARGTFFYPRNGYGQISEALAGSARANGADIRVGSRVRRVAMGFPGGVKGGVGAPGPFSVEIDGPEGAGAIEAEHVWSTIPVGLLVRMMDPSPPAEVIRAAESLEQRAMILVYLVLDRDRYTEYDAHYFPSLDLPMTRLSEPKNYSGRKDPGGRTVLCAEIPCAKEDPAWSADAGTLARLVEEGLGRAGLPDPGRVLEVAVRRLPSAYPLYRIGWERHFETIDGWLSALPDFLTFGRQGLYAHDNTHHALAMARAAVRCLDDGGRFDAERWETYREAFAEHVVED